MDVFDCPSGFYHASHSGSKFSKKKNISDIEVASNSLREQCGNKLYVLGQRGNCSVNNL